jgi:hypothetical protein
LGAWTVTQFGGTSVCFLASGVSPFVHTYCLRIWIKNLVLFLELQFMQHGARFPIE